MLLVQHQEALAERIEISHLGVPLPLSCVLSKWNIQAVCKAELQSSTTCSRSVRKKKGRKASITHRALAESGSEVRYIASLGPMPNWGKVVKLPKYLSFGKSAKGIGGAEPSPLAFECADKPHSLPCLSSSPSPFLSSPSPYEFV